MGAGSTRAAQQRWWSSDEEGQPSLAHPASRRPQVFLKAAGYLVGEYGRLLLAEVPGVEQFRLLHARFLAAAPDTKVRRRPSTRRCSLTCPSWRCGSAAAAGHCWHQRRS